MKRSAIAIVVLCLLAAIGLGVFSYQQYRVNQSLKLQLSNRFQQSFAQLTTAVGELDTALGRGVYATTSNLIGQSCTEIFGMAQAAATAAGELPYSDRELPNTNAFLSQVADYSLSLSKAAQAGGGYQESDRANLTFLAERCAALSQTLQSLQAQLHDGHILLDEYETAMHQLAVRLEAQLADSSNQSKEVVSDLQEVPTLIYDGPFSDHIEGLGFAMLDGAEEITGDTAIKNAAAFFGLDEAALSLFGSGQGKIPTYCVTGNDGGGDFYIEVTKAGGYVLQMVSGRMISSVSLSAEDGVARAAEFLARNGFEQMHESYHINQNGMLTVNFAATQNGIVLYPDLIKVSIALDSGAVMSYEAKGYLSNHTQRELATPAISAEDASAAVDSSLEVLNVDLALIPTPGKSEVLCYEFATTNSEGEHYMVYVNAETGNQEKILILIEDENGTLAV